MPVVATGALPSHVITESTRLPRPRFWATVWTLYEGSGWAENTLCQRLRHLDQFYRHSDIKFGEHALDNALGDKDVERIKNISENFFIALTSKASATTSDAKCWDTVSRFIHFFANHWDKGSEQWRALKKVVPQPGAIRPPKKGRVKFTRALPNPTLKDLLAKAQPGAQANPFKTASAQVRNWLLVLLMFVCGLRRGEVLLLTLDSLKQELDAETGEIRYWLDVTDTPEEDFEDADTRATRPSIKTSASYRQIPISGELAETIERYVMGFRVDSTRHRFLITSYVGHPLSAEAVTKALRILSTALNPEPLKQFRQRTKKEFVSSHDLRHSCACILYVLFSSDGDKDKTFSRMRAFFGWDVNSTMPETYARAAIQDDVRNSISKTFDSLLATLRGIG